MEPLSIGPEIRELTLEEIQTLAPDFEPYGLPNPAISTAVGIIASGKIVAYQFLQLKLHAQPTKVDDGYTHLFPALCRKSEEIILAKTGPQWVYCFATPGRMSALAESRGMAAEPWTVWSKLITPEIPARPVLEMLPIPELEVSRETVPEPEPEPKPIVAEPEPVTPADALMADYKAQFPVTDEELEQYPSEEEAA